MGALMSLTAMTHTNQFWDAKSFKYLHRWRCRQSKLNWNLTSKNMYHTGKTNEKPYFFPRRLCQCEQGKFTSFYRLHKAKTVQRQLFQRHLFSKTIQSQSYDLHVAFSATLLGVRKWRTIKLEITTTCFFPIKTRNHSINSPKSSTK